jgi:YgiT-type zinc finger domain-containing protein
MRSASEPEYGGCPCGGTYENRRVEVAMTVDDNKIQLSGIPQGACPVCGSRVYKLGVLERIEATMKSGGGPRSPRE